MFLNPFVTKKKKKDWIININLFIINKNKW